MSGHAVEQLPDGDGVKDQPSVASAVPYITFYRQHDISPVSQDLSDLERHFNRRAFLYRQLGLAPALLAGRRVIEFGPGSGHNALFTASCKPAKYRLVDGNDRAIRDLGEMLRPFTHDVDIDIVHQLFQDYRADETFDVVLAEGCIPFQLSPCELLASISRSVAPGGVFVFTSVSTVSCLSEIVRRLLRDRVMPSDTAVDEQLEVLRPLISHHLSFLPGRSRPVDDWILDNIVQPFLGKLMSIEEAARTLSGEFDFYGSSPRFATDLRWYKEAEEPFVEDLVSQSHAHALNFLDHRLTLPAGDPALGRELELLCSELWKRMQSIENVPSPAEADWAVVEDVLENIASMVSNLSAETCAAIREARDLLNGRRLPDDDSGFARLWGRGMQYLSFARRTSR